MVSLAVWGEEAEGKEKPKGKLVRGEQRLVWRKAALLHEEAPSPLEEEETRGRRGSGFGCGFGRKMEWEQNGCSGEGDGERRRGRRTGPRLEKKKEMGKRRGG